MFEGLVAEISERHGDPAMHGPPVSFHSTVTWSVLWFVEMENNGFHVKVEGDGTISIETWAHMADLSRAAATVKTVEEAERILRRILPEALDPERNKET